ncbi:MAG: hypothetical protein AB1765_04455, partial [Candidatus Hydrogenedentota bacterium]
MSKKSPSSLLRSTLLRSCVIAFSCFLLLFDMSRDAAKELIVRLKKERKRIVFTNGCFDILHVGHA